MLLFAVIAQLLCAVGILASVWLSVCNYRTHADILKVIEAARHRPMTGMTLIKALNAVHYHTHMRARILGRDPFALYDPMVRDAIENPRTEIIEIERVPVSDGPPPRVN